MPFSCISLSFHFQYFHIDIDYLSHIAIFSYLAAELVLFQADTIAIISLMAWYWFRHADFISRSLSFHYAIARCYRLSPYFSLFAFISWHCQPFSRDYFDFHYDHFAFIITTTPITLSIRHCITPPFSLITPLLPDFHAYAQPPWYSFRFIAASPLRSFTRFDISLRMPAITLRLLFIISDTLHWPH